MPGLALDGPAYLLLCDICTRMFNNMCSHFQNYSHMQGCGTCFPDGINGGYCVSVNCKSHHQEFALELHHTENHFSQLTHLN